MKNIIFVAVALLVVAGLAWADNPLTLQRFSAKFQGEVAMGMGIGFSAEKHLPLMKRALGAALPLEAEEMIRQANTKSARAAGNFPDLNAKVYMAVSGETKIDVPNNLWLTHLKKWQFGIVGVTELSIKLDATSLLLYDIGKNFTWDGVNCSCSGISGPSEMPLMTLPPLANLVSSNVNLKQSNGESVTTSLFAAEFKFGSFVNPLPSGFFGSQEPEFGPIFSTSFNFYVDASNQMRRVEFVVTMGVAPVQFNLTTAYDFWDIVPLDSDELVLPATQCANKCISDVISTIDYTPCTTAAGQCACLPPVEGAFCDGVVSWSISNTLYVNVTHTLAENGYNSALKAMQAVASVDAECQLQLKNFFCKFYFPVCNANADFVKPEFNATLSCFANVNENPSFAALSAAPSGSTVSVSASQANAAYKSSGAFSAYRTSAGDTESYNTGGLVTWQIALIVVGSIAVAALIIGAVLALRFRRPAYETL